MTDIHQILIDIDVTTVNMNLTLTVNMMTYDLLKGAKYDKKDKYRKHIETDRPGRKLTRKKKRLEKWYEISKINLK